MEKQLALQLLPHLLHVEQVVWLYFLSGNFCPRDESGVWLNSLMVVWLEWLQFALVAMNFIPGFLVLFQALVDLFTYWFLILWLECGLMILWMQLQFMEDQVNFFFKISISIAMHHFSQWARKFKKSRPKKNS